MTEPMDITSKLEELPETEPEPWGSPFAMDTRNWK